MFKFGFNFNLTPCFFLEISFNSCLICTARPAFYGVNGQSSTKICFKYNVFDIVHCVFFCGSVDQKITGKEGSTSSSFAWFVFFFSFFFGCCCIVLFVLFCFFLYNFCLFVCFSFIPTAHLYYIWTSRGFVIHVFFVIMWDQPWLGMATYDKASLGMIR